MPGGACDAIKVMYCEPMVDVDEAPLECLTLWMAQAQCERVLTQLAESTQMLPPTLRQVGERRVGYLLLAPTWD